MNRFIDKIILVTGGSSGIGFAVAQRVIAEGGRVIITGRNKQNLERAIEKLGPKSLGQVSDVARISDIEDLYAFVEKETGAIHGLFANAGTANFCPVENVTEEMFDRLMTINVKGLFFTLQKAIPLIVDGGSVVINASVAASTGKAITSVYAATKAAARSMARTFSVSLLERKIRVNTVSPGPIETALWYLDGGIAQGSTEQTMDKIRKSNPMKRFGKPEEVAAAVAFLLASESSYITGIELFVDGGFTQL